jgi:ABC-type polysaccharide/polyol phosphate export permease
VEATVGLSLDAMLLALLIVVELVLAAGVGLLLAPLQIYLRDVARMVALALMIGFWLTPVFYRQSRVPPEFTFVYQVNPMAHLIEAQRQILLYRELPHATSMLATAGLSLVILALGSLVFHALRNSLPDRL